MGPVHYDQEPSMYMGGPGAPPPLTLGLPSNYGAPIYLQQPMTASGPYNYGSSINKVTSYNPLPRPSSYAPTGTAISGNDLHLPALTYSCLYVLFPYMNWE